MHVALLFVKLNYTVFLNNIQVVITKGIIAVNPPKLLPNPLEAPVSGKLVNDETGTCIIYGKLKKKRKTKMDKIYDKPCSKTTSNLSKISYGKIILKKLNS